MEKQEKERPLFRWTELCILLPLLMAALLIAFFLLQAPAARGVRIERDGQLYEELSLDSVEGERIIEIDGEIPVKLLITKEYACFLESGCPDQVCVRSGKLTKAGETAVCLPARVTLRMVGSGGADGVTY